MALRHAEPKRWVKQERNNIESRERNPDSPRWRDFTTLAAPNKLQWNLNNQ